MDPDKPDICVSDVVKSVAGRDRGELYFVLDADAVYLTLVNGGNRPLEKPKRKKRKHVEIVLRTETRVAGKLKSGDKVLNGELRRELASIGQTMQANDLGG